MDGVDCGRLNCGGRYLPEEICLSDHGMDASEKRK
jgi:hypothetical protein